MNGRLTLPLKLLYGSITIFGIHQARVVSSSYVVLLNDNAAVAHEISNILYSSAVFGEFEKLVDLAQANSGVFDYLDELDTLVDDIGLTCEGWAGAPPNQLLTHDTT